MSMVRKITKVMEDFSSMCFVYTNHQGKTTKRHVRPMSIRFGSSKWHTQNQWLLKAFDFEKQADREFAIKDIKDEDDS